MKRLLKPLVSFLLLGVASGAVAACSTDSSDTGTAFTVSVDLSTKDAPVATHKTGRDLQVTYGAGIVTGQAEFAGENVDVELLYLINHYTNGNGPFEGFWTFSLDKDNTLSFDYAGSTSQVGEVGYVKGTVKVLGGTGKYAGVTGKGTATARRDGQTGTGAVLQYTLDLQLSGVD